MKQEILDKYGLTEAEFYKKYPTEAAFRKAHPEEFSALEKFAKGGKLPEGILKTRLESHMSPEEVNNYIANYASGGMIKRADGSYSKRGLWDNIRANKGSGKKPTKEMLKQEAKIRAEEKAMGGYMYAEGGKLPTEILRARLESHMSSDKAQDYINEYGKGGYTVTRSSDRKGKTHKVTGPDGTVKYFGDSKLGQHPKDAKRKKAFYARHATNLKNNPYFRAFARKTWAEGGYLDSNYTDQDFAKGGRFWKDLGAGAYGAGEGLLDTLSMGLTDSLTDKGYTALQNLGNSTEDEKREQNAVRGFSNAAGAIGGAVINPAAIGSAIGEGSEGLGAGISETWGEDSEAARMAGQILPTAGNIASMFTGDLGAQSSQAAKFAGSDFGKYAKIAGKVGKGYNQFSPFMNMMVQAKGGYMPSIAGALEGFNYANGGQLVELKGPKHTEGGIMLTNNAEVEGGETKLGDYIYSDQLEIPGKKGVTFAKESKRIKNKYKLRKGGDIYDRDQEKLELMDLQDMNEEARVASEAEEAFEMAKGGWIKKATESIKRRGTEGVCTGSKFGGPTCPPGSKRYNLAKTFRKMAKARKHAEGGFIGDLYALGGDIDMFDDGGGITFNPEDFISGDASGIDPSLLDGTESSGIGNLSAQELGIGDIFENNSPLYMDSLSVTKPTSTDGRGILGGLKTSADSDALLQDYFAKDSKTGVGNKFDMSKAASLFGKYGSLLGLPLQGMAVGQANRAIKDELKRLKGEKPEVVDYGTVSLQGYAPTLQDPTQALLEQDQLARAAKYNTEQLGAGNLGTMMANKQVADAMAMKQKARTRAEYDQANAALKTAAAQYGAEAANKSTLYNKELQRAGMDATSQSKANYQNQLFKLAQAMGQNRASGLQAGAQGLGATAQNVNYNQQMLNTLGQLFNNPETLKMLAQFGAKAAPTI